MANAVNYMHSKMVAHFDIKLENILLDEFYNIKIADFGSAEVLDHSSQLLRMKKGTRCFMAPEVDTCNDTKKSYSPLKADMYSLGVCLHLLLFGEFPTMNEESNHSTLVSADEMDVDDSECFEQNDKFNVQHSKMVGVSSECRDVLNRMIRNNPDDRCTIDEVVAHPWLTQYDEDLDSASTVYHEFESRKEFIMSTISEITKM